MSACVRKTIFSSRSCDSPIVPRDRGPSSPLHPLNRFLSEEDAKLLPAEDK